MKTAAVRVERAGGARLRIDGRTLGHATAAAIRRLAVLRVERGERPSDVIRSFGMCRTSIYRWIRSYRASGLPGISRRRHPGRRAVVRGDLALEVRAALVGARPADLGLRGDLWTRATVASLLRQRWGLSLSRMGVGRLLARMGLRPPPLRGSDEEVLFERAGRGVRLVLHAAGANEGPDTEDRLLFLFDGRRRFLVLPLPRRGRQHAVPALLEAALRDVRRPILVRTPQP